MFPLRVLPRFHLQGLPFMYHNVRLHSLSPVNPTLIPTVLGGSQPVCYLETNQRWRGRTSCFSRCQRGGTPVGCVYQRDLTGRNTPIQNPYRDPVSPVLLPLLSTWYLPSVHPSRLDIRTPQRDVGRLSPYSGKGRTERSVLVRHTVGP